MPRRLLVVLALLATAACRSTDTVPPQRADDPDLAAEYYASRRQGTDDRHAAYAVARAEMRRLPQYSTELDLLVSRDPRRPAAHATQPVLGKWKFLGPGNIGGRTRVLVFDHHDHDVMYAGGVSGGLWKTVDAGASWEPIGDDLANIAINSLVMHPADSKILYAGTGEGYFREEQRGTALPLRGDGIFVTRDAGASWTQLPSTTGPDFDWVNDLVISRHAPSRIYAATRTGVWRSDDEGATWTRTLATTVKGGCLDLVSRGDTAGDYLFASCGTFEQATVHRNKTAETASEWEAVLSEENMGRTTLAIAPSNPSIVYALAASNRPGEQYYQAVHALYRSDENGDAGTWEARITSDSPDLLSRLLLTNPYAATLSTCRNTQNSWVTMGWYCNAIAVDPVDPERVWVGGVDAFRSDDGGRTWGVASYWWENPAYDTYLHADQHAIIFHPEYDGTTNRKLFFANDGGVARTDDALAEVALGPLAPCKTTNSKFEFTSLNNDYGVTQFYHGSVSPDGRTWIAGAQDNGTLIGTVDRGSIWRHAIGGDGAYTAIDPDAPTTMYGSTQFGRIYRSVNGGAGWQVASAGLDDAFLFITPLAIDTSSPTRLWVGGRRMWRTENRGGAWGPVSTELPGRVSAIAVSPSASDVVLAGTNSGHIVRTSKATTANAQTVWSATLPRGGFVSSIAFDPSDTSTVYATYAGFGGEHLWRSQDGGATWVPVVSNLPDLPVHSIAIDPTRRERLYLGTDLGVFVSLDSGATWAVENTGFANVVTETVVVAQGHYGPAVYAFTHGRGAWRTELVTPGKKRRSTRK